MQTIQFSELRSGSFINYNGEIITKEQAEKLIESGQQPALHTVSDAYIQQALDALATARKNGRPVSDFQSTDTHAKRIIY